MLSCVSVCRPSLMRSALRGVRGLSTRRYHPTTSITTNSNSSNSSFNNNNSNTNISNNNRFASLSSQHAQQARHAQRHAHQHAQHAQQHARYSSTSAPKPVNYDEYISDISWLRPPSAIRELQPLVKLPGMISLGGGMPNPTLFPFRSFDITLRGGETLTLDGSALAEGLQYSPSPGLPALVNWIHTLNKEQHSGSPADVVAQREVCITTGSQDAIAKSFEMLINPGDTVLVEEYTYSGSLAALAPLCCNLEPVPMDGGGMVPEGLEATLQRIKEKGGRKPRVLYVIPTGHNPAGTTLSAERRQKLYDIASEHDLLVLEDDPYWFLKLNNRGAKPLPSFLSLDRDGRVIRFDSVSKIISSGLRIGWVTGPSALVNRVQLHMQGSSLHCSSVAQALLLRLLDHWGMDGFLRQVDDVQDYYTQRRDVFVSLCDKYLKGKATWTAPTAGMFVWFHLPNVSDTRTLITERAVEKRVLMVPGVSFSHDPSIPSPFVRASFSTATDEEMEEALKRFSDLLDE